MRAETMSGVRVSMSARALERWHELCRPAKDAGGAAADLLAVIGACGEIVSAAPAWLRQHPDNPEADAYLMLGPDVTLPLRGGLATTCIVAGQVSALGQLERSRARRVASAARATRRGKGTHAAAGNEAYGRRGAGHRKRNKREGTAG